MHCKQMNLKDVWRTCNKIAVAIFRIGLDFWSYFLPLDPNKNCLISESQFISIFSGPLQRLIGISNQEICELCDYFRIQDGRIFYTQLCQVVCGNVPNFANNPPLVDGLEWEDPLHINSLKSHEERQLNILITKIASLVNMRKLILRPYFQDYELISKNNGTVTTGHFARILDYLGILVSPLDYNLLLKKYLKDGYTINYIAFTNAIEEAIKYMDQRGMLDIGGDVLSLFPGRLINAELPKLPRPDYKCNIKQGNRIKEVADLVCVIQLIQQYVLEHRLRVNEFFRDFDIFNSGKITISQFRRGLDGLGICGIHRLYLSSPAIETLITQYRDPCDPSQICWRTFEDDIDQIFTTKELEKYPCLELGANKLTKISKINDAEEQNLIFGRTVLEKVIRLIKERRILLRPIFTDYDKNNNGYISRTQMRRCLGSIGIISNDELCFIEGNFSTEKGFNYSRFLIEVEQDPNDVNAAKPKFTINVTKAVRHPTPKEKDIVLILAKIKGKVVRERVRVMEFLRDFDRCNEQVISRENFQRGLSVCRFDLNENEIETLMDIFASPMRENCVDYRRFSDVVEESFTQLSLERAPLIVPVQHIPTSDCDRNFLNFNERITVSGALQKLCKYPDFKINLMPIFKDFDKNNCGTVSQVQFMRALTVRGVYKTITSTEFDVICKCFSYERGMRDEVDYRAFLKSLDVLHEIKN